MFPKLLNRPPRKGHSLSDKKTRLFQQLERRDLFAGDVPGIAGRGQDLLLVVNPADENALRIAGEYRELRNIPDRNIVFVTPPQLDGFTRLHAPAEEFWADYVDQVHSAIDSRGLHGQIDMIAALGQTHSFNEGANIQSLTYGLMQLDQYAEGMTIHQGQVQTVGTGSKTTTTALRHSDSYDISIGGDLQSHQYYVAGLLGVSDQLGNSVDDIIEGLRRSVTADGTKPAGTIYFEENKDLRSELRESQWDAAQDRLNAIGIPFIEESNVPGGTPQNRNDVRGGVVGHADAQLPNGSTYLPGAWVDNLTSFGGNFTSQNQTKATEFIAAGAAASSGTVAEPGGIVLRSQIAARFPDASIFEAIDSGITLAEAYYHAVDDPDMLQFIGDMLAQPYADIPTIELGFPVDAATDPNEPAVYGRLGGAGFAVPVAPPGSPFGYLGLPEQVVDYPVSGRIRWNVSAQVASADIQRMELFVDGQLHQTIAGAGGDFIIDTNDWSDGLHEFRFVAVADNAAETEGIAIANVEIDNIGRSIDTADYGTLLIADDTLTIGLTTEGEGVVERIELRHLGRVVATALGTANEVSLNMDRLAYYDNQLVPVAVFDDGMQVAGSEITVHRSPKFMPGQPIEMHAERMMGIQAEYFLQHAGSSIDGTDFSVDPDLVTVHAKTHLSSRDLGDVQTQIASDEINGLAIRLTGSFDVSEENAGEFTWSALNTNDSIQFSIDGEVVLAYDNLAYGADRSDASVDTFLAAGRHDFEILFANQGTEDGMNLNLLMRGSDGVTRALNSDFVYQLNETVDVPTVPEPPVTPSTPADPNTPTTPEPPIAPEQSIVTVDFESEDQACWDAHLVTGYSNGQCGAFTEIFDGSNIQLIQTDLAYSGNHALQLDYRENEDRALAIMPIESTDFIRTSQQMRFSADHDFAFGQKIHRIVSFDDVAQTNHFDMVINAWGAPEPGRDDGDMTGVNGSRFVSINYAGGPFDWGTAIVEFQFERERWYEITAEVQLNTPGQADGSVRLLIDGELIAEKQGIQIRESASHRINQVSFGGWYSNGAGGSNPSLDPASETKVLIDDILVATSPIQDSEPTDPPMDTPTPTGDLVAFEIDIVDQSGNPIAELNVGDIFIVEVYAQTLQTDDGVFSATLDLTFDPSVVVANGAIEYGADYPNFQSGDTSSPGVIDELGAVSTVREGIDRRSLLARISMAANAEGTVTLQADPSDDLLNGEVTIFNIDDAIATDQIVYGNASLTIRNARSLWQNAVMPTDVNDDGATSPVDAVRIINALNRFGSVSLAGRTTNDINGQVDVNGDGFLTALDALMVINELNSRDRVSVGEPVTSPSELERTRLESHDLALIRLDDSFDLF